MDTVFLTQISDAFSSEPKILAVIIKLIKILDFVKINSEIYIVLSKH